MDSSEILAKRIKEKRFEYKMTQAELAKSAKVTTATISGYEKGVKMPSVENIIKIADVFNVSIDWLCGHEVINTGAEEKERSVNDIIQYFTEIDKYYKTDIEIPENKPKNMRNIIQLKLQTSEEIQHFFESWQKIKEPYEHDFIDDDVMKLWLEKELTKVREISIKPRKIKPKED